MGHLPFIELSEACHCVMHNALTRIRWLHLLLVLMLYCPILIFYNYQ